jgi:hypothetical protein
MTKEKNKKKKDKKQEEGEGIPLKVMIEIRRTNLMEPLTKEHHDKKKALTKRANRQRDTDSQSGQADQTERLNQKDPSDMQLMPSAANSVSAADRKKPRQKERILKARGISSALRMKSISGRRLP